MAYLPIGIWVILLAGQENAQKLAEAATLARAHQFAEADAAIKDVAVPTDPLQAIAYRRLRAAIYSGMNQSEASAAEIREALKLSPTDAGLTKAMAVADLACVEAELKQPSHTRLAETLQELRRLRLADDDRLDLRRQMGERLLAAGEFQEAIVDLSEALRADPSNPQTRAQLAAAQFHVRDLKSALANAMAARDIHETADVEALLGEVYEASGDSLSAERSFERAVELAPGEERFRLALAVEFAQHQTFDPAIEILTRAQHDFPSSARTATALGLIQFLAGREAEGRIQLIKALQIDPNFAPALRYLGEIALTRSSPVESEVIKLECDYADAHPSDVDSNAACGGLQMRAATGSRTTMDWQPILARLSRAASNAPERGLVRCQFGKALDEAHEWAHARGELEACVRLDQDSIDGHYRLARVYERLGLKQQAARELQARAAAEQRITASNEARERDVKQFLYTIVH
jgi:tetratricopeptide (TPR) repeat protein